MTASPARRTLRVLLAAALALTVAGSAAAQQSSGTPFSADDLDQECTANNDACRFEIGPVPPGHRWDLRQVACANFLQSTAGTEAATLFIVGPGNNTLRRFALIPVKLTESRFAISQRVAIPIPNRTIVRIVISTEGQTVIGGGAYCTISGDDVVEPQP